MIKNLRFILMSVFVMMGMTTFADNLTVVFDPAETFGNNTSASGQDQMAKDGVTVKTTSGGLHCAEYRFAKDSHTTFTSTVGNITKIEFTCTAAGDAKYGPGNFAAQDGYSFENKVGVWTGNATSVSFYAEKAQVRASKIIVTIGEGGGEVTPDPDPIPEVVNGTCADVFAGTDGIVYQIKGKCTKIISSAYGNWYLEDETGSIYIYGTLDKEGKSGMNYSIDAWGIEIGDIITVKGARKTWNTTVELVDVTVLSVEKGQNTDPQPVEEAISVAKALEIIAALEDGATTSDEYVVKGYVVGTPDFQRKNDGSLYGNVNFDMADEKNGTNLLTVFRAKNFDNQNFTEEDINSLKDGDLVTLKGKLQKYVKDGVTTPELKNCYLISINGDTGINTIHASQVVAPVYNLAGQRMVKAQKGLNIQNGKKFIMK
jgi:hypothetical protein